MLDKIKSIMVLLSLTFACCSITYAEPINKVASSIYLQSPAENTEQYKVTINKGEHITDAHLELLPNSNGEYWVPKGYSVKVNADCEDGYEQDSNATYEIDQAKTINLGSNEAPPSKVDLLEERLTALESEVNAHKEWKYLGYIDTAGNTTLTYDSSKYVELAIVGFAGRNSTYVQPPIIYPINILKDKFSNRSVPAYGVSLEKSNMNTAANFNVTSTYVRASGGTINNDNTVGCSAYIYAR